MPLFVSRTVTVMIMRVVPSGTSGKIGMVLRRLAWSLPKSEWYRSIVCCTYDLGAATVEIEGDLWRSYSNYIEILGCFLFGKGLH